MKAKRKQRWQVYLKSSITFWAERTIGIMNGHGRWFWFRCWLKKQIRNFFPKYIFSKNIFLFFQIHIYYNKVMILLVSSLSNSFCDMFGSSPFITASPFLTISKILVARGCIYSLLVSKISSFVYISVK